jgi:hypothetical protein
MKLVASMYTPEQAAAMASMLREHGVASQTREGTEESGLEVVEILVADEVYDRACEVTEAWLAAAQEKAQSQSQRRCPACRSPNLDALDDSAVKGSITGITYILRCRDCGRMIAG